MKDKEELKKDLEKLSSFIKLNIDENGLIRGRLILKKLYELEIKNNLKERKGNED